MFFLATADAQGRPDCSYRGGMPGFVPILDSTTLVFPDYDGNGMFRSLGNILGVASLEDDKAALSAHPGAQLMVRVTVGRIFPNCPRYIHKMKLLEHSVYAPRIGREAPTPRWKQMKEFRDDLPRKDARALPDAQASESDA